MADTITTQMEIEQFSESGLWSIYYISLYDEVGNGQLYYASDLDSMGIQTSLFVISVQDTTSPSMTYFSFTPDTVDVTDGPAVVSLTLGAIDDLSGIQYGQASF